ncbi:hypothetical protein EZE20_17895 [Arundinibacter roseus]|uniref:Uncharacterized protein n=1 Tax=Arundinibacter roseus TaxID=2070510 RepID=A0A4V6P8K8_9BACT|nr:hypothetical protein EZE20_17895 [Arundinibacter roseus]
MAAANSRFAIGGVSCSADGFVVAESFVLRINICAEKSAHSKSAKRCVSPYQAVLHKPAYICHLKY